MKDYKDILSEALSEIKEKELECIPDENAIKHEFSGRFERNSNKLIKAYKKKSKRSPIKTLVKIAAVVFATIISVAIMSKTNASPDKFFDFLYYVYEKYIVISDERDENYQETEYITYTLIEIPEDFEEYLYNKTGTKARTQWKKSDSDADINLFQSTKNSSGYKKINAEGSTTEEFTINEISVLYITTKSSVICLWEENGYDFELSYPVDLGKDFAYQNIGNLIVSEKNK